MGPVLGPIFRKATSSAKRGARGWEVGCPSIPTRLDGGRDDLRTENFKSSPAPNHCSATVPADRQ